MHDSTTAVSPHCWFFATETFSSRKNSIFSGKNAVRFNRNAGKSTKRWRKSLHLSLQLAASTQHENLNDNL